MLIIIRHGILFLRRLGILFLRRLAKLRVVVLSPSSSESLFAPGAHITSACEEAVALLGSMAVPTSLASETALLGAAATLAFPFGTRVAFGACLLNFGAGERPCQGCAPSNKSLILAIALPRPRAADKMGNFSGAGVEHQKQRPQIL